MAAILDFPSWGFLPFLIHNLPPNFLPSFESEFHNSGHGSRLGFQIKTILVTFWSSSRPNTSYQVSSQLAFWFRRSKNRFLRWCLWQPSWISNQNDFSYFWSTSCQDTSYPVFSQLTFQFKRRSTKLIFKMAAISDFRSEWFLAIFDLWVVLILPTKFQVNWPFGSGEVQYIQDCSHSNHLWFAIRTILAFFLPKSCLDTSTKFRVNWHFGSGKEAEKIFKMVASLESWLEPFQLFLIYKLPWYFLQSLESTGLSVQEKKCKINFQDGGHSSSSDFRSDWF